MSSEEIQLINPWDVVDTFFRDTNYYKSQHQIDSFDEFIFSEQNGIRNIIKRENPFILYKGENQNTGKFSYEIKIYYGETLSSNGEIVDGVENILMIFLLHSLLFSEMEGCGLEDDSAGAMFLPFDQRVGCTLSSRRRVDGVEVDATNAP